MRFNEKAFFRCITANTNLSLSACSFFNHWRKSNRTALFHSIQQRESVTVLTHTMSSSSSSWASFSELLSKQVAKGQINCIQLYSIKFIKQLQRKLSAAGDANPLFQVCIAAAELITRLRGCFPLERPQWQASICHFVWQMAYCKWRLPLARGKRIAFQPSV